MAERGLVASDDINHLGPVAHENISARHLVEAVDRAQQRRFPRARKPHEHADFAFFHHQAGARRTQHGTGFFEDFRPALARIKHAQRLPDVLAKKNIDIFEFNRRGHFFAPAFTARTRSRMIARMTIARPASMPSGMLRLASALFTGLPKLGAPIRVANTTME